MTEATAKPRKPRATKKPASEAGAPRKPRTRSSKPRAPAVDAAAPLPASLAPAVDPSADMGAVRPGRLAYDTRPSAYHGMSLKNLHCLNALCDIRWMQREAARERRGFDGLRDLRKLAGGEAV